VNEEKKKDEHNKEQAVLKTFSNRIVEEREKRGIKQNELAKKINIAASTLSRYENLETKTYTSAKSKKKNKDDREYDGDFEDKTARVFPSIYTAYKIARALGLSLDYLCGLTDIPSPSESNNEEVDGIMADFNFIVRILEGRSNIFDIVYDVSVPNPDPLLADFVTHEWVIYSKMLEMDGFVKRYDKILRAVELIQLDADDVKFMKNNAIKVHLLEANEKIKTTNNAIPSLAEGQLNNLTSQYGAKIKHTLKQAEAIREEGIKVNNDDEK
jgi:transcriptional regulator with XRE-family HTH domain